MAVLNAAIVLVQSLEDVEHREINDLTAEERVLSAAVDAMLSARHNLRETGKETS